MRACLSVVLHTNASFSLVLWLWAESTGMAHEKKGCVMAGPRNQEEEEEEKDEEEKGSGFLGL